MTSEELVRRDAYVFDVDGTLAKMNGRSPYDPTKYHTDLPNKPVIDLALALTPVNEVFPFVSPALIICSGRDDTYFKATASWLAKYWLFPDALLMRKAGDRRKDDIIKEEIYHEHIEPYYNVLAVFDDRDRVVAMWRRLGLMCCQVAEGNF